MYGMGCAVGDFDNDGRDDIYITAIGGSHLFRNLGNGKFADVTAKAGVGRSRISQPVRSGSTTTTTASSTCSSRTTLNGRRQRIRTARSTAKHKSYCTPEAYKGESATLFHNLGNGRL